MPSKSHILHVVESLRVGGVERLVHDLVIARGAERTSVACLDAHGQFGESLLEKGFSVKLIGKENGVFSTAWRMRQCLLQLRPDIVHCHNLPAFLYGALGARMAGDIPVVLTKHGIKLPGGAKGRINRFLLRRTSKIAVSPQARDGLQNWLPADASRVRYIPNGLSLSPFENLPSRQEARLKLGLPRSSFVVGTVSRIMPCKNHQELVGVFAGIVAKIPDALLLIAGDGPLRPAVEERVRAMGLEQRVIFLGERRDIPDVLAALDCFCLPSDTEGMPMTILEAMAAGLAIVSTDVGGIPECLEEGRTALMVPPHAPDRMQAALLAVAADPVRAGQMGSAAKSVFLKKFSVAHMMDAYEECYREIMDGRAGSGRPELVLSEPRH